MSLVTVFVRNVARAAALGTAFCAYAIGAGSQAAPISSSIHLRPVTDNTVTVFFDGQGATLNPLGGTRSTPRPSGNSTTSTASATWSSAGRGSVSVTNSWNMVAFGDFGYTPSLGQFNYRFIADANGLFQTNYTHTLVGAGFAQGFTLNLENITAGGTTTFSTGAFNTTGSQNFSILDGIEYEFSIRDPSNAGGPIAGANAIHGLTLDWVAPINEVGAVALPAPGPFAVFGVGLLCLGLVRCRKST